MNVQATVMLVLLLPPWYCTSVYRFTGQTYRSTGQIAAGEAYDKAAYSIWGRLVVFNFGIDAAAADSTPLHNYMEHLLELKAAAAPVAAAAAIASATASGAANKASTSNAEAMSLIEQAQHVRLPVLLATDARHEQPLLSLPQQQMQNQLASGLQQLLSSYRVQSDVAFIRALQARLPAATGTCNNALEPLIKHLVVDTLGAVTDRLEPSAQTAPAGALSKPQSHIAAIVAAPVSNSSSLGTCQQQQQQLQPQPQPAAAPGAIGIKQLIGLLDQCIRKAKNHTGNVTSANDEGSSTMVATAGTTVATVGSTMADPQMLPSCPVSVARQPDTIALTAHSLTSTVALPIALPIALPAHATKVLAGTAPLDSTAAAAAAAAVLEEQLLAKEEQLLLQLAVQHQKQVHSQQLNMLDAVCEFRMQKLKLLQQLQEHLELALAIQQQILRAPQAVDHMTAASAASLDKDGAVGNPLEPHQVCLPAEQSTGRKRKKPDHHVL
jgi:hypothetical protein